jgi:hypothetical protein
MKGPSDPMIANLLNSLNLIQSGLRGLLLAGNGFYLPEKENIGPNQHSWLETAMQMGVKHVNKCPTNSKVDSVLMVWLNTSASQIISALMTMTHMGQGSN